MKLAVNYSPALSALLAENPKLPVDYIKVPTVPFPDCWDQFIQGKKHRQLLPHLAQPGVIALGHYREDQCFNRKIVLEALRYCTPLFLSTHLEARCENFLELAEGQHQNFSVIKTVLINRFLKTIKIVKEAIELPLVLENFPYYSWWCHFRVGSEPDFISEICEAGDCDFLLDISHANCSAYTLGRKLHDYLDALPLQRLREIHLAGSQKRPEGLRDTHTALTDDDYQLLEWILAKNEPEFITIEYGGLPDQILNLKGEYEPISRNNPNELLEIILRIRSIIGA